MTQGLAEAF